MNVNIELYKVFYAIAKEESITKAANRLFVSQSAVTQSIKKLEEQLGGKLFVRNKNGVKLTAEGAKLYNYIESSINTLNNAENIFSQYLNNELGTIRVGCGSAIGKIIFPNIIEEFIIKYPNIKLEIFNVKTNDGKLKLLKNEIDVLFIENNVENNNEEFEIIPLTNFKFCFFTTKKYLNQIGKFKKENISEYNFILPMKNTHRYEILNQKLIDENIEINPQYQFSSANLIEATVEKGIGIGYINELIIKDKLRDGRFVKVEIVKDLEGTLVALVKDKKTLSNSTLKFIEEVKKSF